MMKAIGAMTIRSAETGYMIKRVTKSNKVKFAYLAVLIADNFTGNYDIDSPFFGLVLSRKSWHTQKPKAE